MFATPRLRGLVMAALGVWVVAATPEALAGGRYSVGVSFGYSSGSDCYYRAPVVVSEPIYVAPRPSVRVVRHGDYYYGAPASPTCYSSVGYTYAQPAPVPVPVVVPQTVTYASRSPTYHASAGFYAGWGPRYRRTVGHCAKRSRTVRYARHRRSYAHRSYAPRYSGARYGFSHGRSHSGWRRGHGHSRWHSGRSHGVRRGGRHPGRRYRR